MKTADYRKKLKQARERKGWSIHEAATQIEGASITSRNSYYDIEQCDGEITSNCSLSEISRICNLLNIRPRDLFCDKTSPELTIEEVVAKINEHCAKNKIPISQFEDTIGWRVESCLSNPKTALEEWNFDCLKDICEELGIDWQQVISNL
ncbi:MAG: helix-turn-helix transcriptional regulator [Limisphaerales bacterium]